MATVPTRSLGCSAVALAALLLSAPVRADERGNDGPTSGPSALPTAAEAERPPHRSGFSVGAALGFGVASIVGFPADVKKAGYIPYYTVTGVRPAPLLEAWIGGALAEWVSFGIGFTATPVLATGDNKARSAAGLFHVEVYPLFYVREAFRDLGLMIDAGTGVASITSPTEEKLVDSSAASLLGGGVFWEPLRFWRFKAGPFLMGNYMWSDTARRPAIFAGFRTSLYTGLR